MTAIIAEGSANFGIEMAFPGDERLTFERDVLFPLAGLDPTTAASYYRVQELMARMNYAGNEAARLYIDGDVDADGAVAWLVRYAMYSPGGARQRLRFIDQYRSYVINYNLGLDLVRDFVHGDGADSAPDARWDRFLGLLTSPRLPGPPGPTRSERCSTTRRNASAASMPRNPGPAAATGRRQHGWCDGFSSISAREATEPCADEHQRRRADAARSGHGDPGVARRDIRRDCHIPLMRQ